MKPIPTLRIAVAFLLFAICAFSFPAAADDHVAVTLGQTFASQFAGVVVVDAATGPVFRVNGYNAAFQTIGVYNDARVNRFLDDSYLLLSYKRAFAGPGVEFGDGTHPLVKAGFALNRVLSPYAVYRGRGSAFSVGTDLFIPIKGWKHVGSAANVQYSVASTPRGNDSAFTARLGLYFHRQ